MNTNCLQGLRCPNAQCQSEGPFRIVAESTFEVHDDGTEHIGDVEWTDDSYCQCVMCSHHGAVSDFSLKPDQKCFSTQVTLKLSIRHTNDAKYGDVTDAVLAGLTRGNIVSKLERAIKDLGGESVIVAPDGVIISGWETVSESRDD